MSPMYEVRNGEYHLNLVTIVDTGPRDALEENGRRKADDFIYDFMPNFWLHLGVTVLLITVNISTDV